jgi:hypothetical protein
MKSRSGSSSACRTTWADQTFSASVLAIEMSLLDLRLSQ